MSKQLKGIVTSVKMKNTATVSVERKSIHPLYRKGIKQTKKYHAAYDQVVKEGDRVTIVETRPLSKTKCWKILK